MSLFEPGRFSRLLVLPLAAIVPLAVHFWAARNQSAAETHLYTSFLIGVLVLSTAGIVVAQIWFRALGAWMRHMGPILAAALLLLSCWETITSGFRLLPLPYFPGPPGVLQSLINDRQLLFDSTWHSLLLLLGGYALGVTVALITGVCIGLASISLYWGKLLSKVIC